MAEGLETRVKIRGTFPLQKIGQIKKNIYTLAIQPLLEVFDEFKGKKLDYTEGYREIRASFQFESQDSVNYLVLDHAGSNEPDEMDHGRNTITVASKSYTSQREIDELKIK